LERLGGSGEEVATTIITVEEQLRGWLAEIHRVSDPHRQIPLYERLQRRIEFFAAWSVVPGVRLRPISLLVSALAACASAQWI